MLFLLLSLAVSLAAEPSPPWMGPLSLLLVVADTDTDDSAWPLVVGRAERCRLGGGVASKLSAAVLKLLINIWPAVV